MNALLHFLIGSLGTLLVTSWAAHKAAESNGSAPAAALVVGVACASLAHFLSPWATPVVLGLVSASTIKELRQTQALLSKLNDRESPMRNL